MTASRLVSTWFRSVASTLSILPAMLQRESRHRDTWSWPHGQRGTVFLKTLCSESALAKTKDMAVSLRMSVIFLPFNEGAHSAMLDASGSFHNFNALSHMAVRDVLYDFFFSEYSKHDTFQKVLSKTFRCQHIRSISQKNRSNERIVDQASSTFAGYTSPPRLHNTN